MNLKELAFPLRIYWDMTPVHDNPAIDSVAICEAVAESKVFTLSLLDADLHVGNVCIEILENLTNANMAVALTVLPSALDSSLLAFLCRLKVNELLVDTSTDDNFRLFTELVRQQGNKGMVLGASFQADEDNYRKIPDVVSFCANNDIIRLVFPMQRLTAEGNCFSIVKEEGKTLGLKLSDIAIDKMRLTIHDPFLWRVFYPAAAFPGGGCQAANSMIYISSGGIVYPCPSMTLALGDLKKTPLKTILSSDRKKRLRKDLIDPPQECLGCGELNQCLGGCRGRAFALTGSLSQRDPACA